MLLSVIIVSYKVPHYLQLCLESVQRAISDIDSEIIVVDNASGDSTLEMLSAQFPRVRCIANTENVGFSKANNQGVKAASGSYVCILNPDMLVPENCFIDVLEFAETKRNLGAVGIQLIDGTGNFLPESKRNLPTPRISLLKLAGNSQSYYANHLSEIDTGKVAVLVGAFMFMKRSVYEEVDGFDERYFMYGEDIDLSYEISKRGYSNYYLGSVSAIHFKGESTIKDREYASRFYGAMRLFAQKHFYKNVWLDRLFKLGVDILKHTYSSKEMELERDLEYETLYWISDQNELPNSLKTRVVYLNWKEFSANSKEKLERSRIVFDLEGCRTEQVIETLKQLKNRQNTFRIRPSNCNFSCGSDSASRRSQAEKFQ